MEGCFHEGLGLRDSVHAVARWQHSCRARLSLDRALDKEKFSELIELMDAEGAQRGVVFHGEAAA